MKVTVEALPWVSETFGGSKTVRHIFEFEAEEGSTLESFLRQLGKAHPKFGHVMFAPSGEVSEQVAVVVNNRLPDLLDGYETVLKAGDRVLLVQAYAGGADYSGFTLAVRMEVTLRKDPHSASLPEGERSWSLPLKGEG